VTYPSCRVEYLAAIRAPQRDAVADHSRRKSDAAGVVAQIARRRRRPDADGAIRCTRRLTGGRHG
jgi:hypothetical protein